MPVLEPSHRRLGALAAGRGPQADLPATVESDPAVALAVLAAHGAPSIAAAVEQLGPRGVARVAAARSSFDPLEGRSAWARATEVVRLHGIATVRATDRIANVGGYPERDVAVSAALLHDIGKLPLARALDGYAERIDARSAPEARLAWEREACGADHAELGGALARRFGLHERLARLIESHHEDDPADDAAAIVRLADMLAHYERDAAIDLDRMIAAAARVGLSRDALSTLLYEVAFPLPPAARAVEPCPLSARELDVIRRLGEGMLYKQIAAAEGLSPSTVRNHLHRAYSKLAVADRAQAVLVAERCGWI